MKKAAVFIFIVIVTFRVNATCKSSGYSVGWEPDQYPPFQITEKENKEKSGLDFEIIQLLRKETGCNFELIETPWARLLKMLELGQRDIVMAAIPSKERLQYARATVPYIVTNELLFAKEETIKKYPMTHRRDIWKYPTLHYVLIRGYKYGPIIHEGIDKKAFKVSYVTKDKQAIDMLNYNRVDITLFDGLVAQELLKNTKYKNISYYKGISTLDTKYSFLISKKSVTNGQSIYIEEAFKKIVKSKEYKLILKRYQSID